MTMQNGEFRDSRRQGNRVGATLPVEATRASVLAELHDVGLSLLDAINVLRAACDAVQLGAVAPEDVAPALAVVRHQVRETVYRSQLLDGIVRQRAFGRDVARAERTALDHMAASLHRPASR